MGKSKIGSKKKPSVKRQGSIQSSFLSSMSHDLRTPLNSILSLSRVLQLQAKERLSSEEFSYLEVIERNGRILLSLINDIIDFSKIDAGRIELKIKKINLESVLNTIIENNEQIAEEKGISISLKVLAGGIEIESDEVMLYKIFQNIIGNAVKFTEKGGVSVIVSAQDSDVKVTVKDTGIGIDKDDLLKIFEEFGRIEGRLSKKYEGTGLGLAIAKKAARIIDASISAESKLGYGSVFSVILPVLSKNIDAEIANSELHPIGKTEIENRHGNKPLVLVIEDDPDNLTTIKVILKKDYRIIEALDGKTGLALVLKKLPDLVLLDMALPQMNGFMVVKRIRDNKKACSIPVIAMTALTMETDRKRILETGCDAYLAKPFDITLFINTIKQWVVKRHE